MAQRIQPVLLIEDLDSPDPGQASKRAGEFHALGWASVATIVEPAQADGTPGRLVIALNPNLSAFNTTSEQH